LTLIAAADIASDAPQRTHVGVPGMFSKSQLTHCMAAA
jgi:hypothetical protein